MRLSLAIVALFAVGALTSCGTHDYEICEWYGDWPFCGSTDRSIGDRSGNQILIDWTKDSTCMNHCVRDPLRDCGGSCGAK